MGSTQSIKITATMVTAPRRPPAGRGESSSSAAATYRS
jgi:hypothetical protein